MSKKGEERILFFVFVLIVLVISGGITAGMYAFFNQGYDARREFVSIINSNLEGCLMEKDFFSENFSIFSECGMNDNFIGDDYAIVVGDGSKELILGKGDLRNRCELNIRDEKQKPYCLVNNVSARGVNYSIFVGSTAFPRSKIDG